MSDEELDSLFKEAADGIKIQEDEGAWKNMASRLDHADRVPSYFNWKSASLALLIGVSGFVAWKYGFQEETATTKVATVQTESSSMSVSEETTSASDQNANSVPNTNSSTLASTAVESIETAKNTNSTENAKATTTTGVTKNTATNKNAEVGENTSANQPVETTQKAEAPNGESINNLEASKNSEATKNTNAIKNIGIITAATTTLDGSQVASTSSQNLKDDEELNGKNSMPQQDGEALSTDNSRQAGNKTVLSADFTQTESDQNVKGSTTTDQGEKGFVESRKSPLAIIDSVSVDSAKTVAEIPNVPVDSTALKEVKKKEKQTLSQPSLSVKLSVAPDFSSIEFFTLSQAGFNYGLQFAYNFKRWSILTGAISSKKIYTSTEVDEPYTSPGGNDYPIEKLDGECRVLDIPLNVYYTFYQGTVSLRGGLGLSSYLMLSEDYKMYVDTPYGSYVYEQSVSNENYEWFKMMNISIIVQKKLTNRFSVEVEPFVKAPLAGVGEGEVSLVTLGAFVNLQYDLFRSLGK